MNRNLIIRRAVIDLRRRWQRHANAEIGADIVSIRHGQKHRDAEMLTFDTNRRTIRPAASFSLFLLFLFQTFAHEFFSKVAGILLPRLPSFPFIVFFGGLTR